MKRTAVIMAGGSGERFWPLSRQRKPKQLLNLISEKTMLEEAIERITEIIPLEDIYIITSKLLLEPIRETLPDLPKENVIAEPAKRNTAPCLALAAAFISAKYENIFKPSEISISVLTADHLISPTFNFQQTITSTLDYVERNEKIAIIGIKPQRPETGYGYIEIPKPFDYESDEVEIQDIVRFCEKPNYEKAIEFLESGKYLWNSGMFFWRLDTFINQLAQHLFEVGSKIPEMAEHYKNKTNIALPDSLESITPIFEAFPDISIDYGLMEKAQNIVIAKAIFNWDDVGSWDSLSRVLPSDDNNNLSKGNNIVIDTQNSVLINTSKDNNMVLATLCINDLVVVLTDDAVLVCPKDRVQEVKRCVVELKNSNKDKWV